MSAPTSNNSNSQTPQNSVSGNEDDKVLGTLPDLTEPHQTPLFGRVLTGFFVFSTWFSVIMLVVLLAGVFSQAWGWVNWDFLSSFDSRKPEEAGIMAAIWGSFWLILLTGFISVPIGVGAAVYLEEFSHDNWFTRLIRVNLSNLAGVPSIVYGILGFTLFVRMFGFFEADEKEIILSLGFANIVVPLPFGRSLLSGALTLSLLILPVVIVVTQEALRAIPDSLRHASLALGATRWQTVRHQILPISMPGIMTGVILALSRAIGETAPLVFLGALTYVAYTPGGITSPVDAVRDPEAVLNVPFDSFTALPIQIYNWVQLPKSGFQHVAAAGIVVLLVVLLVMNSIAVYVRNRVQRKARW